MALKNLVRPHTGTGTTAGHLTDTQTHLTRAARNRVTDHGEAPSVRELAAAVGLSSTSSVAYELKRMKTLGVVVETRGHRRADRCPHCGP
nr:hypothetical protein [Streptomyces sp. CBMA152]